ncbi:MAG TPA: DUF885 domain-containing protein [Acidimicrobiales bacterium]
MTSADLQRLADDYWESVLASAPTFATLLGDRRFDDRIEDVSAAADEALRSTWSALLAEVDALDPATLAEGERVTRSLLRTELATGVELLGLRLTELASDQMQGIHAGLLTAAPQLSAPTPESAGALLERYRQVGTLVDQAVERFRAGLAAGRTPARIAIDRSINQLDNYLASDPAGDPFATMAGPEGWDGEAAWRAQLQEVVRDVIRPALGRYRAVLADELLPAARPDDRPGLTWLGDDGAQLYEACIRQHTTLDDLGADEIHRLGLAEVERLAGEYAEVGGRLFGTTDQAEIFARLQGDPDLRYDDADQIMTHVRRCVDAAWAAVGDWFGRLPAASCDIVPVPDFLAPDSPAAYYFPPAADGSRPGAYFVNLHNPGERGRFETASIAYHEAIPGHHLQLTIASELTELPRFQRFSFSNTAFAEGWALYTERLADEMGLYADDLDRLGLLAGDSWRAGRLVVDTGLHALGWTRRQAIDFLVANVPAALDHIEVEVDRYIAMPGQAVSYKVGQLEIQRQRAAAADAAAKAGRPFDIKGFHDVVLGSGSLSLPVLREVVGAWTAATTAPPASA